MIEAEVHRPSQPQTLRTKFSSIFRPFLVCVTSGWNWTPKYFLFVCHCCVWASVCFSDLCEISWDLNHFVTVVHPNILSRLKISEKCWFASYLYRCVAELTLSRRCYFAAKLLSHSLHAVADTKYRNTWIKHVLRYVESSLPLHFRATTDRTSSGLNSAEYPLRLRPSSKVHSKHRSQWIRRATSCVYWEPKFRIRITLVMNIFSHFKQSYWLCDIKRRRV